MMRLHHIAILCAQKQRSVAFYEMLGFHVRSAYLRPERGDEIVFMEQGDMVLEIFVTGGRPERVTDPEAYGLRHLALQAQDVQAVHQKLTDAGYTPEAIREDTLTGESMFFVKDPDGLPIEIHE